MSHCWDAVVIGRDSTVLSIHEASVPLRVPANQPFHSPRGSFDRIIHASP